MALTLSPAIKKLLEAGLKDAYEKEYKMAMSKWEDLISPGIKKLGGTIIFNHNKDGWFICARGEELFIPRVYVLEHSTEETIDLIIQWARRVKQIPLTIHLIDVGEGMLVPKGFVEHFDIASAYSWYTPQCTKVDLVGGPPEVAKAFAEAVDKDIMDKYKAMYKVDKSVWLVSPHDPSNALVKPATPEEIQKYSVTKKFDDAYFPGKVWFIDPQIP